MWLAISGLACGTTLAVVRWLPPLRLSSDAEFSALVAARESLRGNDDASRDQLRLELSKLQLHPWTPAILRELQHKIGPEWNWRLLPADRGSHALRINRVEAALADWPAILRTIALLEQEPGAVVQRLDISAKGAGGRRKFEHVTIKARFAWSR